MAELPIHALRAAFDASPASARLVIGSPTGSGKSTEVPLWCRGRVLVVEPRRVACRALAARVADLEQTPLGTTVGYRVRDDTCATADTRILFCTPGILLRWKDALTGFGTIILDEFHERSLEMDLLLALLLKRFAGRLMVMSATLQDERVARHMEGTVLRAEGRLHPVDIRHVEGGPLLPDPDDLAGRVRATLDRARQDPGDVLVFLPGKAEITECARIFSSDAGWDILPLHGELTADEQRRAFKPSARRKLVLATNVAETSITLPGVGVVVDSGLVRQTRYHRGRGHLALVAVAQDSADQRAGRAGRTGPGVAYRLWSASARLAAVTAPEVFRQSLVPMLLGAAAWDEDARQLALLDRPREDAWATAAQDLRDLGALEPDGQITAVGRELFDLPLDPALGRLLVAARAHGVLEDAVDLVSALSTGRPLFAARPQEDDPLRADGCDATALIRAVREGQPGVHALSGVGLQEARRTQSRLRALAGLGTARSTSPVARHKLALAALAADPRCAHVPRRRGGHLAWSNGAEELELGRHSAASLLQDVEALLVLDTHAVSQGHGDNTVRISAAMPVPAAWLLEAGLGQDRITGVSVERGVVVTTLERVYAQRTLQTREDVPKGALAREAITTLFLRGSIFRASLLTTTARLSQAQLWSALTAAGVKLQLYGGDVAPALVPTLEAWVENKVARLGVESGEDLAMLSAQDFLAPPVPEEVAAELERVFPRAVRVGETQFNAEVQPAQRLVTLRPSGGGMRGELPAASFFPRFGGFRVVVQVGQQPARVVRERTG
jgi:ATP-dependent helicase HrpB